MACIPHCQGWFPINQRTIWHSNVRQQTPVWSHSHSMGWWRCATWDVTVTDTVAPSYTSTCHLPVQPQQLKRRPNAKKINILKSHATNIYFPLHSRRLVLSTILYFCSELLNFIWYRRPTCNILFIPTPFFCNPALQYSMLRLIRQCWCWSATYPVETHLVRDFFLHNF